MASPEEMAGLSRLMVSYRNRVRVSVQSLFSPSLPSHDAAWKRMLRAYYLRARTVAGRIGHSMDYSTSPNPAPLNVPLVP